MKRLPDGSLSFGVRSQKLTAEEVLGLLNQNIAPNVRDCVGQWNAFRADFDAVLRVTAFLNTTVAGQRAKSLFLEDLARWDGC